MALFAKFSAQFCEGRLPSDDRIPQERSLQRSHGGRAQRRPGDRDGQASAHDRIRPRVSRNYRVVRGVLDDSWMAQSFVGCDRDQSFLMPPDIRDWLAEDHLAWFVLDAVAGMNLGGFYGAYRRDGVGRRAYDPAMMGWIQLVVATPDVEELRCLEGILLLFVLLRPGRVWVDIRLLGAGSIGSGSGRRLLEGRQAKRLRSRRVCCRALVSGGFARVAGCRHSLSRRCRGVICPSPSVRRSRSGSLVVLGCGRSRVSWVGRRRRYPESCNATLRSDVADLSIEPRPPRGMLSVALNVPSRPSSRSTRSCGLMCRTGFRGLCSGPTGATRVLRSAGAGGVMDRARIVVGGSVGARSRSLNGCAWTSPMMSRCACLMRRSISRSISRVAGRCAGS